LHHCHTDPTHGHPPLPYGKIPTIMNILVRFNVRQALSKDSMANPGNIHYNV
jgi:hypothetical protein